MRQATMPFIRDRIEESNEEFFTRVDTGFLAIAAAEPARSIRGCYRFHRKRLRENLAMRPGDIAESWAVVKGMDFWIRR